MKKPQPGMLQNRKHRANCKYKRIKTIIRNCMQVARKCNIKLNLVIFTERGRRLQETFTDSSVSLKNLRSAVLSYSDKKLPFLVSKSVTNCRPMQLESREAKTAYKWEDQELQDSDDDGSTEKPVFIPERNKNSKTISKPKLAKKCKKLKTLRLRSSIPKT